ncbi:MAG: TlpA family protein disulfide reductase [Gammaproteobacteria bacterium]|jgi:peroxiredoxin|nr:TlpA family protein disulfide reductase [Gammaproteobacteria bacterium]
MYKQVYLSILLFSLAALSQGTVLAANLKPVSDEVAAPSLTLKDLQGDIHDLKDYRGQVVLVQFWATYCGPCRKEMPSMNKMMTKMGDTPFKILAVDMGESEDEVKSFVSEVKPEFTILMDEEGKSIEDWRVFAAPSNFIIGPDGNIKYTLFGGVEWDSDELIEKLKALAE